MFGMIIHPENFTSKESYERARKFIVETTYQTVHNNPDSISMFTDKDFLSLDELFKFFDSIQQVNYYAPKPPYFVVMCLYEDGFDPNKDNPIGITMASIDSPWYTSSLAMQELLTASFSKKCVGLARYVANWMEGYASMHHIKLVGAACANSPYSKMVENTYKKQGYKVYPTFYKEIR